MFENAAGASKFFAGANQENAAYSPVLCGETVAIARARYRQYHTIRAIAVYGMPDSTMPEAVQVAAAKEWVAPCGRCRQVINETAADDCLVIMVRGDRQIKIVTFSALLPMAFGPKNLGVDPLSYHA